MKKEEMQSKSVKELEEICKAKGLHYYSGKRHLKKDEMIKVILESEDQKEDTLAKEFSEKKMDYIRNVEAGTIIAFLDNYGKARTAKVEVNNSETSYIIATTEFGRTFKIPYKCVLWVRKDHNSRWPKPVYQMLKGINV